MAEKKLLGIDIGELVSFGFDALIYRSLGMRIRNLQQGSDHGNNAGETESQKRDRVTFGFLSTKDEERYGEMWKELDLEEQRALMQLQASLLTGLPPDLSDGLIAKAARGHIWDGLRKKITNMEVTTITTEKDVSDDPKTGKRRVGEKTTRQESKGLLYLKWLAGIITIHGTEEAKKHLRTGNMIPDEAPFLWIARNLSLSSLQELERKYGSIIHGSMQTKTMLHEEQRKTTEMLRWIVVGAFVAIVMLVIAVTRN